MKILHLMSYILRIIHKQTSSLDDFLEQYSQYSGFVIGGTWVLVVCPLLCLAAKFLLFFPRRNAFGNITFICHFSLSLISEKNKTFSFSYPPPSCLFALRLDSSLQISLQDNSHKQYLSSLFVGVLFYKDFFLFSLKSV